MNKVSIHLDHFREYKTVIVRYPRSQQPEKVTTSRNTPLNVSVCLRSGFFEMDAVKEIFDFQFDINIVNHEPIIALN